MPYITSRIPQVTVVKKGEIKKERESKMFDSLSLEVPGGFEPPCTVLQTGD